MAEAFTIDEKSFALDMERLRLLGALTRDEMVSKAARITVRQAIFITPFPRKGTKNLSQQKALQTKYVLRDLMKRFRAIAEVYIHNPKWRKRLRYLLNRKRNLATAFILFRDFLNEDNVVLTINEPSKQLHEALRFKKSLAKKRFVMPDSGASPRASLIAQVQQRIFRLKGGWNAACQALKVKTVAQMRKHGTGEGWFKVRRNDGNFEVEFGNKADGLADTRDIDTIMGNAFYFANVRMAKEIEQYMKAIGRGDSSGVRSKLQRERFVATEIS